MTDTLYYYPGNASLLPHIMLREIGAPFKLSLIDRGADAQKADDYLRLNPTGRIPTLVVDGEPIYETGAIALFLTERHPEAGLAPPPGDPGRARFLRWMVHLANTPQPAYREWYYPEQHVADPAVAPAVKRRAGERLGQMFALIADQLGDGPWLLGDRYSAVDPFLMMLVRWGRGLPTPLREIPALAAHAERVLARPAVAAALAAEGLGAPFI